MRLGGRGGSREQNAPALIGRERRDLSEQFELTHTKPRRDCLDADHAGSDSHDQAAYLASSTHPIHASLMLAFTFARRRLAQVSHRNVVAAALPRFYVTQPPPGLDEGEQNIYKKLTSKFSPSELAVQDVSGK